MKYTPYIESAKVKQKFPLGRHTAVLYADIVSAGSIEYTWVMGLFDDTTREPCYFVAAEVNEMALLPADELKQLGLEPEPQASHFLGVFDGNGHANFGASDAWADEERFIAEALRLIREKFYGS